MLEVLYYKIINLIFSTYNSMEVGLGIKYFKYSVPRDKKKSFILSTLNYEIII